MAKKFSKLVLFSALAGAAAAGTYYYLRNKSNTPEEDFDDLDDFDDFDEDLDDEDFSSDTSNSKNRPYVPIDIDNAKEIIGEKVIETLDKTKEKIEHFNVSEKIDKAKEIIEGMTTPAAEPVYTQVDMSAAPVDDTTVKDTQNNDEVSVSATYTDMDDEKPITTTVKFFDDSEPED